MDLEIGHNLGPNGLCTELQLFSVQNAALLIENQPRRQFPFFGPYKCLRARLNIKCDCYQSWEIQLITNYKFLSKSLRKD